MIYQKLVGIYKKVSDLVKEMIVSKDNIDKVKYRRHIHGNKKIIKKQFKNRVDCSKND